MDRPYAPVLGLQTEKHLSLPVDPYLLSYCPSMDLIATVNDEEAVEVFRLAGQKVFGVKRKDVRVNDVCWKYNGQSLAVAWSDGQIELVSADTGKVVQRLQLRVGEGDTEIAKVACLGWGINFIHGRSLRKHSQDSGTTIGNASTAAIEGWELESDGNFDLEEVTALRGSSESPLSKPSLIDSISSIDIEQDLPKLSTMPIDSVTQGFSGADSLEIFSSAATMDTMFHSQHRQDSKIADVLFVFRHSGSFRTLLYNSWDIGECNLPEYLRCRPYKLSLHSSHPLSNTHFLLIEIDGDDQAPLSSPTHCPQRNSATVLLPLRLNFISPTQPYLSLIALKATQLQNLIRYVKSCISVLISSLDAARSLPSRFVANIDEDLQSAGKGGIVMNLFHLAATGNCPEVLKDWLRDQVAERGHKRWESAYLSGLSLIPKVVHENLLPALERCTVVISRLRGLGRHPSVTDLSSDRVQEFDDMLTVVQCIRLIGHHIMAYADEELRHFTVFSKWLRRQIDLANSDFEPAAPEEEAEREGGTDYPMLFAYIEGPLTASKLQPLLAMKSPLKGQNKNVNDWNMPTVYASLKAVLRQYAQNGAFDDGLCNVNEYATVLSQLCGACLERIAREHRKRISVGTEVVLGGSTTKAKDVRMIFEPDTTGSAEDGIITTYVATISEEAQDTLTLYKAHTVEHGVTQRRGKLETCSLRLSGGTIRDVRFVDDESLMVLWKGNSTAHLLRTRYRDNEELGWRFSEARSLSDSGDSNHETPQHDFGDAAVHKLIIHTFPPEEPFKPVKIEVNGRKGRRVVCILGEDGKHYKVFDIDTAEKEEQNGYDAMIED